MVAISQQFSQYFKVGCYPQTRSSCAWRGRSHGIPDESSTASTKTPPVTANTKRQMHSAAVKDPSSPKVSRHHPSTRVSRRHRPLRGQSHTQCRLSAAQGIVPARPTRGTHISFRDPKTIVISPRNYCYKKEKLIIT